MEGRAPSSARRWFSRGSRGSTPRPGGRGRPPLHCAPWGAGVGLSAWRTRASAAPRGSC